MEEDLLTELITIYLSYVIIFYSRIYSLDELINEIEMQLCESFLGVKLWVTLGFQSNEDFLAYVIDGVQIYSTSGKDQWLSIVVERIDYKNINNK